MESATKKLGKNLTMIHNTNKLGNVYIV